jgi:PKD repeat protein
VYGKSDELLGKEQFGESKEYDRKQYYFGPYTKDKGEKIGKAYRFKLVAKALSGDDENLFNITIWPADSEAFSYKFFVRLLAQEGAKMYFYPEIPARVAKITFCNYDMDPHGGHGILYDRELNRWHKIKDSSSAHWAQTPVHLAYTLDHAKRLTYIITKETQRNANMGMRVEDGQGNLLPIYFQEGKPMPVMEVKKEVIKIEQAAEVKCNNKFIFDATKSYDPQNRKIIYFWDFGDGTSSIEPIVTHIYEKPGTYIVKLTVRNDSGLECDTSEVMQTVRINSAPKVAFTSSALSGRVCPQQETTFDASATTDDTPDKLTYRWDFGDGMSSDGRSVEHVYKKGGTYEAKLTVNDNWGLPCSISTDTVNVSLNKQPQAVAGEDISTCTGSEVIFDGWRSRGEEKSNLNYNWDFGDGATSQGKSVKHTYQKGGKYEVILTVDDGKSKKCSAAIDKLVATVNTPPVAKLAAVGPVCVNTEVNFNASDSSDADNNPLKYIWNFGDGTTVEGPAKISHTYKTGGEYNVSVTVDDQTKSSCAKDTQSIKLRVNRPPVADAGPNLVCCIGTESKFDGSGSTDPDLDALTYTWDFGDGNSAQGVKAKHIYTKVGKYTVTLTVKDNSGTPCDTAKDTFEATVHDKPVSVIEIKEKR